MHAKCNLQISKVSLPIEHVKISPQHPQPNGQAESSDGVHKPGLLIAKKESMEKSFQHFLLAYKTTTHAALVVKSPAEVLMYRNICTIWAAVLPSRTT